MNDEPRECPYCGSNDIAVLIVNEAYCMCQNCRAEGPVAEIDYEKHGGNTDAAQNEAYDTAIVLWNRRADDEMPV